jgi:transglutaminase-like putative cysteine protease
MLGVMITLMVLVRHDVRERFWETDRLYYDTTIRPKITLAAIAFALGLMIVSIVTPSISVSSIEEFIYNLRSPQSDSQEMARSFGLGPKSSSENPDILDIRRSGSLPNRHLLGTGPELSDQVVMVVQFEAWQGEEPIDTAFQLTSHPYIRNLTYDRYTGRGWESRETKIIDYDAGEQILSTWPENYRLVRQQIDVVEDLGGLMHAFGTPINADQDFSVAWRLRGVETGVFDIFGAIIEGETYRVDSIIPTYSEEELRNAGQNYPGWLRDRYMGLPPSVPDRVLALARELTATEPTPYDRALALERYLRQFPYTLDVTMPPLGQDSAEYFLFILKKGYCDYYATAMVVLARAAGMPARLVTGYIAENYDEARNAYIITADQAHAWTEIYFPGYGWITFEPTSGRLKISRPSEPFPEVTDEFLPDLEPRVADRLSPNPWLKMIGLLILIVVGSVVIGWKVSDWWLVHIPLEKLISKLYTRLYRYGRWIGIPTRPGETPYEFVDDLIHHIQSLAMYSYWADWLLKGRDAALELTDNFIVHMYNPSRRHLLNRSDIIQAYKVLRNRLWMLWLLRRAYDHRIFRPLFWRHPPPLILSNNRIEE